MRTAIRNAMQNAGASLGALLRYDVSDVELDEFTRVGAGTTEEDRAHLRKTIAFLRRLADSMERSLSKVSA
jgi:hypothetical protein